MKLLIGIVGCHNQTDERNAQRDTWLSDLKGSADYRYFLGMPAHASHGEPTQADEIIVACDDGPIRAGSYSWHTPVLRHKVLAMVNYALENGYDWLYKCDDDTYARPARLLTEPYWGNASGWHYIGFSEPHSADDVGRYHWCVGGAGYWLSRHAMQVVVADGLRRHQAEDYAIGQALAAAGIHPAHNGLYLGNASTGLLEDPTLNGHYIALHKVNPKMMHRLYVQDLEREHERDAEDHLCVPGVIYEG